MFCSSILNAYEKKVFPEKQHRLQARVTQFTSSNQLGPWLSPNSPAGISRSSASVKTWGTHLWWITSLFRLYFSILTLTWMARILPVLGSASSARCLDPPAQSLSPRANETNLQGYHNRLTGSSSSPARWSAGRSLSCRDATVAPQTDTRSHCSFFKMKNLKQFLEMLNLFWMSWKHSHKVATGEVIFSTAREKHSREQSWISSPSIRRANYL